MSATSSSTAPLQTARTGPTSLTSLVRTCLRSSSLSFPPASKLFCAPCEKQANLPQSAALSLGHPSPRGLQVQAAEQRVLGAKQIINQPVLEDQIQQLEEAAGAPDLWNDADQAASVLQQLSEAKQQLELVRSFQEQLDDLKTALELADLEVRS